MFAFTWSDSSGDYTAFAYDVLSARGMMLKKFDFKPIAKKVFCRKPDKVTELPACMFVEQTRWLEDPEPEVFADVKPVEMKRTNSVVNLDKLKWSRCKGYAYKEYSYKEIKAIARDIAANGLRQTIYIDKDCRIIDGLLRVLAYKMLGRKAIECYILE